jgi:hypothetical protein
MKNLNATYLSGRYKSVHIGKTYTAQTTLALFIANAVIGEIGYVKKSDNSIFTGLSVIPDNTEIYLIKKIDGSYKSYPAFVYKPTVGIRVGSYGTVTKSVGQAGTTPVKRVLLSYGGSADCGNSINGIADIRQVYTLSITFGQYFGVPDSIDYFYSPASGETITSVISKLIDKVNDPYSVENQGKQQRVLINNVVTSGTLPALTTTQFNVNGIDFQDIGIGIDGFCNVVITNVVSGTQPLNDMQNVLQFEKEGVIVDGRYINQHNLPPLQDSYKYNYLVPTYPVGTFFTGYQFELVNSEKSQVGGESLKSNSYYSIFFASVGGDVETKMNTLFNL